MNKIRVFPIISCDMSKQSHNSPAVKPYDTEKYKVYTLWKHPVGILWILIPIFAVMELLLGMRVPKVTLEDQVSYEPRFKRIFVPCPHCNALHDSRIWSDSNGLAFGNWFGLYCKNCGQIIPCLMNIGTLVILVLTFPLWGWFKNKLKAKWLEMQPKRYQKINLESVMLEYKGRNWILTGVIWGVLMFLLLDLILPFFRGESLIVKRLLLDLTLLIVSGLGLSYAIKAYYFQRPKLKA